MHYIVYFSNWPVFYDLLSHIKCYCTISSCVCIYSSHVNVCIRINVDCVSFPKEVNVSFLGRVLSRVVVICKLSIFVNPIKSDNNLPIKIIVIVSSCDTYIMSFWIPFYWKNMKKKKKIHFVQVQIHFIQFISISAIHVYTFISQSIVMFSVYHTIK